MSDPLGVAGSAVGIVSLGLQVCHGLVQYLSAVKGRKDEIEDGIKDVQRVVSLLYSLNNVLPDVGTQRCTQSLRDNLNSCYSKLEKLQEFLDGLKPPKQSASASRTMRDATRPLIYPFQQAKLDSLNQSLRKDLHDLGFTIQIISMEFTITIRQDIQLISQDANNNSTYQRDHLQALRTQVQQNSKQFDSLRSTISGALVTIGDQLQQTRLIIHDHDQKVNGRLTVMESNLSTTITHHSGITVAKMEEIAQTLSSHSELLANMGIQMSQIRRDTHHEAILRDHVLDQSITGSTVSRRLRPINSTTWTCNCASTLPTSRTSFALWHLRFEYEEQEQHHRGCQFFGIHRSKKRKVLAQLPYKVVWLSARMAFACFQYTAGTSRPSMSVHYKNVVNSNRSPVVQIFSEMPDWRFQPRSATQIVQYMETIECRVLSMYRDLTASPYDRDENDMIHAEIFFNALVKGVYGYSLLDRMIEDAQVLWAVLRVFQKLLEINNDTDGSLFGGILMHPGYWDHPKTSKKEAQNVDDLLRSMAKVAHFNSYHLTWLFFGTIGDPLNIFVRTAEDLSPLYRAIILKSLDSLITCVSLSPKSVLESILLTDDDSSTGLYTVLHMAANWPEGLQYLLSTEAQSLLNDSISAIEYLPPVGSACVSHNAECVNLLMEAGCCLKLSRKTSHFILGTSTECVEAIATNLAKRRLQLLRLAQEKLGRYLEVNTVAVTDFFAASICDSLDTAKIPIHKSLRVESDYKSLFSCNCIPFEDFSFFWDKGFRHEKFHDSLGLLPAMTYRNRMFGRYDLGCSRFLESYKWMQDNGFLDVSPTDPLKLGLNLSSSAYHYIGAMFGSFFGVNDSRVRWGKAPTGRCLIKELSSVQVEDECNCWCNTAHHGCSPIKLLLKSHLDERQPGIQMDFDIFRHVIFHHEIFDISSSSEGESPTQYVTELLRLLTFEALEMTHTCCKFEAISEDIVKDMVSTASEKPAAIFRCKNNMVLKAHSSVEEISSGRLLDDLMLEFTAQLTQQDPGLEGFEYFIEGYWQQRISQLYDPDPKVISEMEQHQAFKGFKAPSCVERYVLPRRILRLLGDDFKLTGFDDSDDGTKSLSEDESLSEIESLSDMKPSCNYCYRRITSNDYDSSSVGDRSDDGDSV